MMTRRSILAFLVVLTITLLTGSVTAQQESIEGQTSSVPQQRRQLWDFWTLLNLIGGCPPGPLGHHCHSGGYYDDEDMSDDTTTTSSSSSGAYNERINSGGTTTVGTDAQFKWWMAMAAAGFVGAVFAIHMGQRKNRATGEDERDSHEMQGAISRRFGAVSAIAAGALAVDSRRKGSSNVEMQKPLSATSSDDIETNVMSIETAPSYGDASV